MVVRHLAFKARLMKDLVSALILGQGQLRMKD